MTHALRSPTAGFVRNESVRSYCLDVPFDPPEAYPELPRDTKLNEKNTTYPMVRDLLINLGLDHQHLGTREWNPFRDIIRPGENVLIKPNLVTARHYLGLEALYGSVVHGSVLRPIIDYAALALRGTGSITIADNPVENSDFEDLMEFTGIQGMVETLRQSGMKDLSVVDLRPKVMKESKSGRFYYASQPGDPLGYVTVDLGKDSLFAEFDANENVHYYTLADQSVDHFDPKYAGESATERYHNSRGHQYVVSRSVLNADVLINVAKMKTHCKAGVTLALKNIIGLVYLKECMPHHRPGPPPQGDSFPHYPARHYVFFRKLYRDLRRWGQIQRLPGFRLLRDSLQKKNILVQQHIEHGNWKGNDTIWRTILDLNRIALYADKTGMMRETPQREMFVLVDGIIAQEGNGPMSGEPFIASAMFGGFNPVAVDALTCRSMGFDPKSIPTIAKAGKIDRWRLWSQGNFNLGASGQKPPEFHFHRPKGWVKATEPRR
jgi:uncharacterized protein (DUF362 family)